MSRRRNLGVESKENIKVPEGFQRVEYLKSDGNAYFYLNSFPLHFIIDGYKEGNCAYTVVCGKGYFWRNLKALSIWLGGNNGYLIGLFSNGTTLEMVPFHKGNFLFNVDLYTGNAVGTFNENTISNTFTRDNSDDTIFLLFGGYGGSYNTSDKMVRIYRFSTYFQDSSKESDLIPCYRKSDSKPGMYDVVNNVFYTNLGTGEFIVGPNV